MFRLKNYVRGAFVDDDFDGYNNNELRRSDERKDQLKHKKVSPDIAVFYLFLIIS